MPPQQKLGNGDLYVLQTFLRELENTSTTVRGLLSDIRSNEVDFAKIQVELSTLCRDVKDLNTILKGGETKPSLITRMHLVEDEIKEIKELFEKFQKENKEDKLNKEKEEKEKYRQSMQSILDLGTAETAGKWQLKVAVASGVFSFVATVVTAILSLINH